jgi:hypothetical protein
MKNLVFALALFGTLLTAPQKSNAAEVVHGARGTAVHTNYNWNDPYWHSHKYGYWNGQRAIGTWSTASTSLWLCSRKDLWIDFRNAW